VYIGKHLLTDEIVLPNATQKTTIGKLLLSPTRTYAPVLTYLLQHHFKNIHGLIHCSGGGQTKCMKYLPGNFTIVKDNLFTPPVIFDIIQQNSGSNNKEMYEVFNMGCRMEVYCKPEAAAIMIAAAEQHGIAAQIIGRVEASDSKQLIIQLPNEELRY
jgi:phosphoribosylformylglycinamidine cyclo-ligase